MAKVLLLCAILLTPSIGRADPAMVLVGSLVPFKTPQLSQDKCLAIAKSALETQFKGVAAVKTGTMYTISPPGMIGGIDCLNGRGVNAAYLTLAYRDTTGTDVSKVATALAMAIASN